MVKTLAAALLMLATTIATADTPKVEGLRTPCSSGVMTSSIFLKIPNVQGDSLDKCHRGEIEPSSFQNSGTAISVVKKIDVSSPHLFLAALVGTHFAEADLTVIQPGAQPMVIVYRMKDAIVSSIDQVAGGAGRETVTLRFATLHTEIQSTTASAQAAPPPAPIAATFLLAGTTSTATMVSGGVSGGQLREFVVNKPIDAASGKLMQASQSGQHLPEVVITLKPQGTSSTFVYRLQDVVVSGDTQQGNGASATEQVRLKPSKIQFEFNSTNPNYPPVKKSYDLKKNKAA
jgi:type VI protein secretion system component Hcp